MKKWAVKNDLSQWFPILVLEDPQQCMQCCQIEWTITSSKAHQKPPTPTKKPKTLTVKIM